MKTYNVVASKETNPINEVMYAYNGPFGIETTHSKEEAEYYNESVKLNIKVSLMFPGTLEEWNNYINKCVIDTLNKQEITYTNVYGTFLISQN